MIREHTIAQLGAFVKRILNQYPIPANLGGVGKLVTQLAVGTLPPTETFGIVL